MKVGYLGPVGSFTHAAMTQVFLPDNEVIQEVACATIPACLRALETKNVDISIVPIENSVEGTVNTTLDFMYHESTQQVLAEVILPIEQNFMVHPNQKETWENVTKIFSHPQAIAQSQHFLTENFPAIETYPISSTSAAAKYVQEHPEQTLGAIGPKSAALEYDLSVVKQGVQDLANNVTRFWLVGEITNLPAIAPPLALKKLSLTVTMPKNTPGALHQVLSVFSWRNINLTKLESRPLKTKLGEYFFLIEAPLEQPKELLENAMKELVLLGAQVKSYGYYPVYSLRPLQ